MCVQMKGPFLMSNMFVNVYIPLGDIVFNAIF